jgi:hypothetical protein
MNTLQMLLTLIAIFLFVSFEQALDSQRNNEDIFRNDSREMQCAKEMLWSDHSNFCTISLKSETNDRSAFERFSVPIPNDVPASTMSSFLSQLTVLPTSSFLHFHVPTNGHFLSMNHVPKDFSLQSQLQVSCSVMSQQLLFMSPQRLQQQLRQ